MNLKRTYQGYPQLEEFCRRLELMLSSENIQKVWKSLETRRPTTLRANTLKISSQELEKKLVELNIETEKVPWFKDAFIVKNQTLRELIELDLYKQGFFYVQSLSSMIPPLVLDPKPGEKILDICAAPGSKTTQMAALMENQGEIVANDTSQVRIWRMEANLKIQGVTNVTITKMAGQAIWQKYSEYFDKTLVDVPCSMEGRIFLDDPKTHRNWSPQKIKELSKMQKWILRSAISATKPGGTIVYSTCTLAPEENEKVIEWILKKEKSAVVLEEINLPNLSTYPAILNWKNKMYREDIKKTLRILPSEKMEGFFVACLKKIKSTVISRH